MATQKLEEQLEKEYIQKLTPGQLANYRDSVTAYIENIDDRPYAQCIYHKPDKVCAGGIVVRDCSHNEYNGLKPKPQALSIPTALPKMIAQFNPSAFDEVDYLRHRALPVTHTRVRGATEPLAGNDRVAANGSAQPANAQVNGLQPYLPSQIRKVSGPASEHTWPATVVNGKNVYHGPDQVKLGEHTKTRTMCASGTHELKEPIFISYKSDSRTEADVRSGRSAIQSLYNAYYDKTKLDSPIQIQAEEDAMGDDDAEYYIRTSEREASEIPEDETVVEEETRVTKEKDELEEGYFSEAEYDDMVKTYHATLKAYVEPEIVFEPHPEPCMGNFDSCGCRVLDTAKAKDTDVLAGNSWEGLRPLRTVQDEYRDKKVKEWLKTSHKATQPAFTVDHDGIHYTYHVKKERRTQTRTFGGRDQKLLDRMLSGSVLTMVESLDCDGDCGCTTSQLKYANAEAALQFITEEEAHREQHAQTIAEVIAENLPKYRKGLARYKALWNPKKPTVSAYLLNYKVSAQMAGAVEPQSAQRVQVLGVIKTYDKAENTYYRPGQNLWVHATQSITAEVDGQEYTVDRALGIQGDNVLWEVGKQNRAMGEGHPVVWWGTKEERTVPSTPLRLENLKEHLEKGLSIIEPLLGNSQAYKECVELGLRLKGTDASTAFLSEPPTDYTPSAEDLEFLTEQERKFLHLLGNRMSLHTGVGRPTRGLSSMHAKHIYLGEKTKGAGNWSFQINHEGSTVRFDLGTIPKPNLNATSAFSECTKQARKADTEAARWTWLLRAAVCKLIAPHVVESDSCTTYEEYHAAPLYKKDEEGHQEERFDDWGQENHVLQPVADTLHNGRYTLNNGRHVSTWKRGCQCDECTWVIGGKRKPAEGRLVLPPNLRLLLNYKPVRDVKTEEVQGLNFSTSKRWWFPRWEDISNSAMLYRRFGNWNFSSDLVHEYGVSRVMKALCLIPAGLCPEAQLRSIERVLPYINITAGEHAVDIAFWERYLDDAKAYIEADNKAYDDSKVAKALNVMQEKARKMKAKEIKKRERKAISKRRTKQDKMERKLLLHSETSKERASRLKRENKVLLAAWDHAVRRKATGLGRRKK